MLPQILTVFSEQCLLLYPVIVFDMDQPASYFKVTMCLQNILLITLSIFIN